MLLVVFGLLAFGGQASAALAVGGDSGGAGWRAEHGAPGIVATAHTEPRAPHADDLGIDSDTDPDVPEEQWTVSAPLTDGPRLGPVTLAQAWTDERPAAAFLIGFQGLSQGPPR